MKRVRLLWCLVAGLLLSPLVIAAQVRTHSVAGGLTLEQCLAFALENRPVVQQAQLDERIGEREIRAGLAGWLPQLSAQYNLQHYLKMPITLFPNDAGVPTPRTIGVANTSNVLLQANQTLYSNDVLQATRAARFVRLQDDQNTVNTKINTVVTVSKAFYDVLLTQEQLRILNEAITRQEKQLHDAKAQYEQGLVDKTDYQRASITLGNILSDRKRALESVKFKHTYLKELMGFAPENSLKLAFNPTQMEGNVSIDTTQNITFANRIEYQQLQTQKQLQNLNINYFRWGFLPSVSAFANYNLVYQNNQFNELFNQSYPNSLVGLSVALPIFQGTRRIQNLRRAQLLDQRLDLDILDLRNRITSEYDQALANYKSDLNEWQTTKNNVALAEDVYRLIKLQYNEGIKTYLDLITAETDLRVTQLNYFNALYRVLASKLDVQRAQGTVRID
ncbi:TolC family protein [Adhaeribacter rhizoryzae]|uniref:TolC family protein n=1 Tax=Adhaeribacter rhizoryzae TaxID=2607907 RepID=A0A5M6DAS4_9BACT|nr:TolC family protein [Adhaeribacter rhizoryzae]KAA5543402.1 TolC family protein [Adhaeribacter rhizoryzae]